MARFVTMKRGGMPGKVAVNADLVTDVRAAAGAFTDIFFHEHQVTVEGTFEQVVAMLTGEEQLRAQENNDKSWLRKIG